MNPAGPPTSPVQGGERMEILDAVRGAAVLGILLANVFPLSGMAFVPPTQYRELPLPQWHQPIWFLVLFLVEAKFYSLFSFLFGVGFAVFIERASRRGSDPPRLFRRRLVGLLIIGFIHSVFVWMGDILMTYAVIGFALVPFISKSDRTVLRWSVAMLLLPIVLFACAVAAVAVAGVTPPPPRDGGLPPVLATAAQAFAAGSYPDVVKGNVVFTVAQIARRFVLMFFPRVFGMFLLGFYIGRRRVFAELPRHEPLIRRVCLWGLTIGVPLSFAGALMESTEVRLPDLRGLLETLIKSIGVPALSMGYAAAFCLVFARAQRLRRPFAAAGQMALTNYLMHSVVGIAIFYGIGLGYFGRVPLAIVVPGAVVFFVLQMIASRAWLTRAAFGPAEWVWRMFTYRRRVRLWRRGDLVAVR